MAAEGKARKKGRFQGNMLYSGHARRQGRGTAVIGTGSSVEFVRCPQCQGQVWNDLPNTANLNRYKWTCHRCGYCVTITGCSKCKSRSWKMSRGVDPNGKGGHRPYFRYQCDGCGRVVGILIDAAP